VSSPAVAWLRIPTTCSAFVLTFLSAVESPTTNSFRVEFMLWPTVSRPFCLGIKHPSGAPRPDFYSCQRVVCLLMWGVLSNERTGHSFTIAADPRQRILWSESRWTCGHIWMSEFRDSYNLKGQVPVFISPRNRLAQLYSRALDSHLVPPYDSQGYGGSIPQYVYIIYLIAPIVLLKISRHGQLRKHHSSVCGPLPSNGRCTVT
jgi:hypothetical protein